jgi:hypothetical protein
MVEGMALCLVGRPPGAQVEAAEATIPALLHKELARELLNRDNRMKDSKVVSGIVDVDMDLAMVAEGSDDTWVHHVA